ncbi:B3GALT1 [Mytilus coruscus]|uniref:Hexosyltransferase n=1 Tax=Mytilus coruscus TaxID=42192 RepID=A0A6J8EFI3_MYTCO|nr:B3GALT1 [Mytilus coruscus]
MNIIVTKIRSSKVALFLFVCVISYSIFFPVLLYQFITSNYAQFVELAARASQMTIILNKQYFGINSSNFPVKSMELVKQSTRSLTILKGIATSNRSRKENATVRPLTCDGCFHKTFHFLINNEDICKGKNESVEILILIMSAPSKYKERNVIRETWLTYTKNNTGKIRHAFLLGESHLNIELEKEHLLTKDIIMGNFKDAYHNLTLKTVMGLQWTVKFCNNAKFIFKTDDDMYVNIPRLVSLIKENGDVLQTSVGGRCFASRRPNRDKRSKKWYTSLEMYPQNSYPGFCSGTGYITSFNVISKVVNISRNIPFFHLEDIYMSLCVNKLGLKLHNFEGFIPSLGKLLDKYNKDKHHPCIYKNESLVTMHQVPIKWIKHIWQTPCR